MSAGAPDQLPPASLMTLIQVMVAPCYVHLGLVENPATGQHEKNLEQARWAIDLLHVLDEKTAGNRSDEETQFLTQILHQLRDAYLRARD